MKFLNQRESTTRFTVTFETNIKYLFPTPPDQKKKKKKNKSFKSNIRPQKLKYTIPRKGINSQRLLTKVTHNPKKSIPIVPRFEKSEKSPLKTATYLQQKKEKGTI